MTTAVDIIPTALLCGCSLLVGVLVGWELAVWRWRRAQRALPRFTPNRRKSGGAL